MGAGGDNIVVRLPWPPACLTPNAKRRTHWTKYRKPAADYRSVCHWLTHAQKPKGTLLKVTFHPPDRRHRDDDGMIGAFKHGRDGIADALGCDDHRFRPSYHFGEPVAGGCVLAEIGS